MNELCRPLAKEFRGSKQRMNVMVACKVCHWSRGNDYMRRHIHPDATWLIGAQKGSWGGPSMHEIRKIESDAGIRFVITHTGAEIDRERHGAILLTA